MIDDGAIKTLDKSEEVSPVTINEVDGKSQRLQMHAVAHMVHSNDFVHAYHMSGSFCRLVSFNNTLAYTLFVSLLMSAPSQQIL
jgi:hypothetical protein